MRGEAIRRYPEGAKVGIPAIPPMAAMLAARRLASPERQEGR
jgi:hypothetical protein